MMMREEKIKKLQEYYGDFKYRPEFMPVLKIASRFIRRFKINVTGEDISIPSDGACIFISNHSCFYDSLVCNEVLKKQEYFCLAGDEGYQTEEHIGPRGTVQGLAFEARGVYWVDRDDAESREESVNWERDTLKMGESFGMSPEGIWCLKDNKLLLHFSRKMAEVAIEASNFGNVYIVPLVINYNYNYKDNYKVKDADVRLCSAIRVMPDMDSVELTEQLEDLFWTVRWSQLEESAKRDERSYPITVGEETYYVYSRKEQSRESFEEFIDVIKSQYELDWEKEADYEILSPEQKLQREMEIYIRPNGEPLEKRYQSYMARRYVRKRGK